MAKSFLIQVQPDRADSLDLDALRAIIDEIASLPHVVSYRSHSDQDGTPYLNITLETNDVHSLWLAIRSRLLSESPLGAAISAASIITCEGEHGWDDYLLLHHFDPSEFRDII